MVTTMVHDHADRVRSYELFAELADLEPVAPGNRVDGMVGGGDGNRTEAPARVEH
jgi:hypothetical protein